MAGNKVIACLGLGSNIDPKRNLVKAIDLLHQKMMILKVSSAWETVPVGTTGPNFINAAVLIETSLSQTKLKEIVIRPIEKKLGRVRSKNKNAPRTIDIDILIWDDQIIDTQLKEHAHTAVPVAEVFPEIQTIKFEAIKNAADKFLQSAALKQRRDIFP